MQYKDISRAAILLNKLRVTPRVFVFKEKAYVNLPIYSNVNYFLLLKQKINLNMWSFNA